MDDLGEGGLVDCPFDRLPSGRGGRAARRVNWEVVRTLRVPDDLPLLSERHPKRASQQTLKHIRNSHHQLARLMATGVDQEEISLITGYSPAYISRIKNDPTFEALVDYYDKQRDEIFVDVVERMKTLGLSTLDELQRRLDDEPDEWYRRELMEMAELMLVKPAAARTPLHTTATIAPVSVNVKFVTAQPREPLAIEGIIVDQPKEPANGS